LLDEHLRGRDGGERIEVDALGRQMRVMRREEPDPGAQVITTVDRRIQEVAERAMAGHAGAVVVMNPRDGDVLAMTSSPAFPLDRFTGTLGRDEWLQLVRDPMAPLMNRALRVSTPRIRFQGGRGGRRPAGGLAAPWTAYCNGEFHGRLTFKDWKQGGHGRELRSASSSPAISFSTRGLKVGPEAITRYARAFAACCRADLGAKTRWPTAGPRAGGRPGAAGGRHREHLDRTGPSVGHPAADRRMMAAVANGGVLWKPRLVQRVERADGTIAYESSSKMTGQVDLSPAVWAFLRHALQGAVNEGGTGAAARIPGVLVAGKTGTAQSIAKSDSSKGQDHAWFASFAPADDPQVVVVVLVERGGKGGQVAAPIARQIYQALFLDKVAMVRLGEGS
jgi:penicillin-binding protein 2